MPARGRFMTVEGGEGAGKTCFTAGLAEALRGRGLPLLTTREPGGTPVADYLRTLFAAPPGGEALAVETEALLVSAARAQHVARRIEPALAAGEWVLCDRFADSMRVYQGAVGGLASEGLEAMIRVSTRGLAPELTFLLDLDVGSALARLASRADAAKDGIGRFDRAQRSFHERLREAYLALAAKEPRRFVTLDADQQPQALVDQALRHVEARFGSV
jgi:dTMP kinase